MLVYLRNLVKLGFVRQIFGSFSFRFHQCVRLKMFKKIKENHQTREQNAGSSESKVVGVSKVRFMQILGLLRRQVNLNTLQFESSLPLSITCYISLISKLLFAFKIFVSCFFPQKSALQLYIGNTFNYTPLQARWLLGIAVSIWRVCYNISMIYQ